MLTAEWAVSLFQFSPYRLAESVHRLDRKQASLNSAKLIQNGYTDQPNERNQHKKRYISLAMLLAFLVCAGQESRNEIISDLSLAMFLAHFLVFLKDNGYHLV